MFSRKYLSWSTWHYINYGFGLALRANDSVFTLLRSGMNLARHTVVDKGMNSLLGPRWKKWKEDKAIERAEAALVQVFCVFNIKADQVLSDRLFDVKRLLQLYYLFL